MIPLNAVSRVVKLLKTEWRLPGTEERVTWWGGGGRGGKFYVFFTIKNNLFFLKNHFTKESGNVVPGMGTSSRCRAMWSLSGTLKLKYSQMLSTSTLIPPSPLFNP